VARSLKIPWYKAFVDCTLPHTEAPRNYLFWSAISVLAGVLKNEVFFKDGLYTLYPNQYIILTGPPGIGKGTAINFAWKMTKLVNNQRLANVLTDKATIPEILRLIAKGWPGGIKVLGSQGVVGALEHSCTIIASELQTLLSTGDASTLSTFCQLWDQQEYENRTKNQGTDIIKDMCVNLIGGTVPDYVRGMERDISAIVAGGFNARCIFIFEDKKSKELDFAVPLDRDPKSKALYDMLAADLEHIAHNVKGEYLLNDEAKLVWKNFYPSVSPLPEDSDAMLNFKGRMRTHVWKMCMILSAARKDRMIIEAADVRDAIFLVTKVRRQVDKVFRGVGTSQLAEPTAKVQAFIEKFGMCTKTELVKATHRHMEPATLDRVLYILLTIGYCVEQRVGNAVYYKQVPKIVQGVGLGAMSQSSNIP